MTTEFKAKPVLEDKFWIVEEQGQKIGTLRKNEDKFVFSNENGVKFYHSKKSILSDYGKDFFVAKIVKEADDSEPNEVHGFKCSTKPHNSMYDIQKRLPLFTKSKDSKSLYCSGY